jgi:quercetin dioxygenase-like cupin family protein
MTDPVTSGLFIPIGTPENPLVNPVTGESIIFHKRARDTQGEVLEFALTMAPGGFISTPHVHPLAEERFEVGEGGEVVFRVNRTERRYKAGDVVVVPAGTPHAWWNPSQSEVTTLIRLRPALDMETLFETMFGLAVDGKVNARGLPNPLQMMVLARHFHREARPAPPLSRVAVPLSYVLAPIGRALGHQPRYERYSGPVASDLPISGQPMEGDPTSEAG